MITRMLNSRKTPKYNKIPVLITSSINVSARYTSVIDKDLRVNQTLRSLRWWAGLECVDHIVVCDGSGHNLYDQAYNFLGPSLIKKFEFLSFFNDSESVKEKGKGFGEGQIINYALTFSRYLKGHQSFAKCTGKLCVSNFEVLLQEFNGNASFCFIGLFRPKLIDTRFFIVNKFFYKKYLSNAYMSVKDSQSYYLEHSFKDALSIFRVREYISLSVPVIIGLSGSLGIFYKNSIFKNYLKKIRNKLFFYIF